MPYALCRHSTSGILLLLYCYAVPGPRIISHSSLFPADWHSAQPRGGTMQRHLMIKEGVEKQEESRAARGRAHGGEELGLRARHSPTVT
jgi:hypothetical protein